jgi:hypothetical protein
LNTRGWVFQERLLSPRILHFGKTQVVWECSHKLACETYPEQILEGPVGVLLWSYFWVVRSFVHNLIINEKPKSRKAIQPYWDWRLMVSIYSSLSLTKPNDRLVALSGLADMMKDSESDEYLAGLWKRDLAHGITLGAEVESQGFFTVSAVTRVDRTLVELGTIEHGDQVGRYDQFCRARTYHAPATEPYQSRSQVIGEGPRFLPSS